ncbi:MAG: twin-arginine translocation pathway signal protein [Alphaproteobacteria bacterium]|nr:twin-arginine translocation pathway signal protein [Alphaproteobacteria bacterium]
MTTRRRFIAGLAAGTGAAAALPGMPALAQAAGDRVRKLVLYSDPQASAPAAYQAALLVAQTWRQLGLEVDVRPTPRQQHSQIVWFERERWDTTMWRMVGRPERSDPDELIFNLFHSTTAKAGFNFVGYNNPDYDKLAEAQRGATDQAKRKELVLQAQAMIDRDQPYAFLVHPFNIAAFNKTVWDPKSIVVQSGVGIRNLWTFIGATPLGQRKDMVLNARFNLIALSPLYISGATDSWVTDLIWDRIARVGPDGLPRPWAAEKIEWAGEKAVDATIRAGMSWHDGRPVTVDDVIFSFEAPARGDKVPMYRPFVVDIDKVERTGERTVRFHLKRPNASFITSSLAKINLVPKHIWEPVLADLANKPENVDQLKEPSTVGSGPFKLARARFNEEIVLERFGAHWAAPKMERWILRIIPNPEATIGMMRSGELNFLGDYGGDPEVLEKLTKDVPAIQMAPETDIGFEFVAFNHRRKPFDEPAFRRALSLALDRNVMVQAAWNGYAVTANSHVSPALKFWHSSAVDNPKTGVPQAREILAQAGYRTVDGKLHYPAGRKEDLKPGE